MNKKQKAQAEAVATLKEWGLADGTTVYAKVNKVSRSGMFRRVALFIITKDWEPIDISYLSAKALDWGYKVGYDGGIAVSGCGMDMLFHTVYSLSYAMGYGALNQDMHEQHGLNERYSNSSRCKECRMELGAKKESIGLKYKQL